MCSWQIRLMQQVTGRSVGREKHYCSTALWVKCISDPWGVVTIEVSG